MSLSNSSSTAELIAVYESVRTTDNIVVAIAALLLYDALLCMDMEVRYVWRSPKASRKLSRLLYIYNRYMSILSNLLDLGLIGTISDTGCIALNRLSTILECLTMLGPASFTTLRVYALSGTNKILTGVLLLLSMGPFLVNVSTLYKRVYINLPLPYGCSYDVNVSLKVYVGLTILSRTCLILADTVALGVTWSYTRTTRKESKRLLGRFSLQKILWENGNVYFCTLVAMNIADMVFRAVELSTTTDLAQAGYVIELIDPISSILNSRFLLAIYESKAHRERGGSSASSFSTVNFAEADPRAAGSPELPQFLHSLAGSIHSFPDHDPELSDPATTTEQQEPEGEGSMDSGSEAEAQVPAQSIEVGEGFERV